MLDKPVMQALGGAPETECRQQKEGRRRQYGNEHPKDTKSQRDRSYDEQRGAQERVHDAQCSSGGPQRLIFDVIDRGC